MKKKGFTLVELVVAMGILAIILTMTVMIITQFLRIQMLNTAMRANTQNGRQTIETIVKESRQATSISYPARNQLLINYYDPATGITYRVTYSLTGHQIYRTEEAKGGSTFTSVSYPITSDNLYVTENGTSIFEPVGTNPNLVKINFLISDCNQTSCITDSTPFTETVYTGSSS